MEEPIVAYVYECSIMLLQYGRCIGSLAIDPHTGCIVGMPDMEADHLLLRNRGVTHVLDGISPKLETLDEYFA